MNYLTGLKRHFMKTPEQRAGLDDFELKSDYDFSDTVKGRFYESGKSEAQVAKHYLVIQLQNILEQPDRLSVTLPAWQEELAEALKTLSQARAEALLNEVQTVIQENRTLFEQESLSILNTLVQQPNAARTKAKAGRYKDVGKL